MTSLADSGGTVGYGYDDTNNVASLTEPGGHGTTFGYDKNDSRISTVYPNGVKIGIARDNSGRVCKIASTRGTLPIAIAVLAATTQVPQERLTSNTSAERCCEPTVRLGPRTTAVIGGA